MKMHKRYRAARFALSLAAVGLLLSAVFFGYSDVLASRANRQSVSYRIAGQEDTEFYVLQTVAAEAADVAISFDTNGGQYAETPFHVENMLPGDSESKSFRLRFDHSTPLRVRMYFRPAEDSDAVLAENMRVLVTAGSSAANLTQLYSMSFADFEATTDFFYINSSGASSYVIYNITASLPTQTGNECQDKLLHGDIIWVAEAIEDIPDPPIINPETGDGGNYRIFAALSLGGSVMLLAVLVLLKKRGERDEY